MKLRYLIRVGSKEEREYPALLTLVRSIAQFVGVEVRNAKKTSYGALEVDVFATATSDFDLFRNALEPLAQFEFVHNLSTAPEHMTPEETMQQARSYFNSERFWECHETLESLWRIVKGQEKSLIQGIILAAAAFVHSQKDENSTALSVLQRASYQLGYEEASYHGIEIASLKENVERILSKRKFETFKI